MPLSATPPPPKTLSPKTQTLFEIISTTPSVAVEKALEDSGIRVTQNDVEDVLKLSYDIPSHAVKFFRWAGHRLLHDHTPYSWNLVVDVLGKNLLFDAMWDAINSMAKRPGLISLATFASVFGSYVAAGLPGDAISTFEVMENYRCVRDVVALNTLMSAVCSGGKTLEAYDYLQDVKKEIRPDGDTYAILMEGWEREGNAVGAKETFAEMVIESGWDPTNEPAYDSFLCTLIKGPDGIREAVKFFDSMRDRRCYPGLRFYKAALEQCVKDHDVRMAEFFWEVMLGRKTTLQPTTSMYNSMLALYFYHNDLETARKMMDDMVYRGAFPDSLTYNLMFRFLIKGRKLRDASRVFSEMVKNECVPDQPNCDSAIRIYLDNRDAFMAMKVWKCEVEHYRRDLEDTANLLVVGLRDLDRVPEAVKYAEDMIGRGIKLTSSTLSKLKHSLVKGRKEFVYEELLRKWKSH
ncbi:pentatricopeptide repeat-containing protein At1g77360, mitochondrial-like [Lotus japonicus]|uniref:pentatricopeptide repeat-containing protein At1g77360, mitochondrial-like n=1 Tax=Lotus japonicus TaxID=34305 RepID=UPI002585C391|nr:pentatricopeptide repeat-containing protein At1g77360, mitochondrial-like [Lotus japonicus]